VWPVVVVTPSAQSVVAKQPVQVNWAPPAGATVCTLNFNGQGSWIAGSKTSVPGPVPNPPNNTYQASYLTSQQDVSKGVTFAATCAAGASAGVASITVTHH
jgi:hypothetical protein